MVGTELGNVHNLQQGQGYATVVNQNALLEDALYQKKAGLLDKQAKKKEAIEDFGSFDPKAFYPDQKEIETIRNGVLDEFVRLQEKGIDNPFKATDPESRALQRTAKWGLAVGEVSKKKEEKYFEFVALLGNEEKAKKIKNADQIKTWFYETSPTKIVNEGIQFPEVEFYEPAIETLGPTYKLSKTWVDANGRPPSRDEAVEYAKQAMEDPSLNAPDGYVRGMTQMYNELMPEDKQKYIAKAKSKANGTLKDQVSFFMADRIYDAAGGEVDLGALMAEDAGKLNVSGSGNEAGANWTYVKGGEKEYATKRVNSMLKSNIGQIERDVEKKKLYGSIDNTPEQNFEKAFEHYYPIYLANIKRDFDPANADAGAGKDAESEAGFNRWLYNLTYGDEFEKQDASNFVWGSKSGDAGTVSAAKVLTPEEVSESIYKSYPKLRVGKVIPKPSFKNNLFVVDVKDKAKLSLMQEATLTNKERQEIIKITGKPDVAVYELNEKNTQIFRKIYKEGEKSQGSNYKPTQQSVESTFFDE